jgi:hypothetical protein
MSDDETRDKLDESELEEQDGTPLPDREAMSMLDLGTGGLGTPPLGPPELADPKG